MNLAIVQHDENAYSETFIRAHREKIPAKITIFYGNWFPMYYAGGQKILPIMPLALCHFLSRFSRLDENTIQKMIFSLYPRTLKDVALAYHFKKKHIDAVLAEYGPSGVEVFRASQIAQIPFVVHFHGFDAYEKRCLFHYSKTYKKMFFYAKAIIVVSKDMYQQLIKLGAPKNKLLLNHYGVDTQKFSGAKPGYSAPIFVCVIRFVAKKSPETTIKAFIPIAKKYPQSKLLFVGEGPLLEKCQELVKENNMTGQVKFLDVCSPEQIARIFKKARAYVQHSVKGPDGNSEGLPLSIIEAQASGLPVISTKHGGITEIVISNKTGFLVNEHDTKSMSKAMEQLVKDPKLAAIMGQEGRRRVLNNFDINKSIHRLWKTLNDTKS